MRNKVMNYFETIFKQHLDDNFEINCTSMAEDAQHHFNVATDTGNSEIEQDIFDWSAEFAIQKEKAFTNKLLLLINVNEN